MCFHGLKLWKRKEALIIHFRQFHCDIDYYDETNCDRCELPYRFPFLRDLQVQIHVKEGLHSRGDRGT